MLFDQKLLGLKNLRQNYQYKIFKLKFKDNIVARAFNWRENEIQKNSSSGTDN